MSHPVITDVGFRGDPAHASSVVKVLAGAGQAAPPGRSIKRTLQLRYTSHLFRIGGACGCRADTDLAKATPAVKESSNAIAGATGVRATAWGERTGRVNWGPSAVGGLDPQPGGIIHKPLGGRQRRGCGHSKRRAGRTAQTGRGAKGHWTRGSGQKPSVPIGRKPSYGFQAESGDTNSGGL